MSSKTIEYEQLCSPLKNHTFEFNPNKTES